MFGLQSIVILGFFVSVVDEPSEERPLVGSEDVYVANALNTSDQTKRVSDIAKRVQ